MKFTMIPTDGKIYLTDLANFLQKVNNFCGGKLVITDIKEIPDGTNDISIDVEATWQDEKNK